MKRSLQILIFFLILSCGFISCGSYDPTLEKTSFTVDNKNIGKILYTLCEVTNYPSYLGGGTELSFEAHFTYEDDGIISFDLAVPSIRSLSQLKKGMDLSDDIIIYKFCPMTNIYLDSVDYELLSGAVTVESISNNAVVLKFSNFKILREFGNNEETFSVNGTISYSIND